MADFDPAKRGAITLREALLQLVHTPSEFLFRRWNWKAALLSALWRGGIFFAANYESGVDAAAGAMIAEAAYRLTTAGFYAAITEQISRAHASWYASVSAALIVPLVAHTAEFTIHWLRGTPNLGRSMFWSVTFTAIVTLFNIHAMTRGIFTVGPGSRSFAADLRALPGTVASFCISPLAAVSGRFRLRSTKNKR